MLMFVSKKIYLQKEEKSYVTFKILQKSEICSLRLILSGKNRVCTWKIRIQMNKMRKMNFTPGSYENKM